MSAKINSDSWLLSPKVSAKCAICGQTPCWHNNNEQPENSNFAGERHKKKEIQFPYEMP